MKVLIIHVCTLQRLCIDYTHCTALRALAQHAAAENKRGAPSP
jgi:hypothetical protein